MNVARLTILFVLILGGMTSAWSEEETGSTIDLKAEYRLRGIYAEPYDLSGTDVRDMRWGEQRLRMDLNFKASSKVGIVMQLDVLDGVLAGDNGVYGQVPSPNFGVSLANKWPNLSSWEVGLAPGRDPVNPDSYVPVLAPREPIDVNLVYGEVVLPVGLLRVGRQPTGYGSGIAIHDGGRSNRWGVSKYTNASDRIIFGTKLDEAIKVATQGPGYKADLSIERGVFLAFAFDWMVQGQPQTFGDDLMRGAVALQWKVPSANWGGLRWKNFFAQVVATNLFNRNFHSDIWSFPAKLEFGLNDLRVSLQYALNIGSTMEVSEGFAELSNRSPSLQDLKAMGARALIDYKIGPVTLTLEGDYATGDADPRSDTSIDSYSFARDVNVGLLLFEHILAFESARSVSVGVENLSSLDAASFPISEASTEGRFTNAIALFPQVKVDWVNSRRHKVHTRFGVLFAWPEANGVVDPIMTILSADGNEISDDAVNFHGGDPGDYYGTEYDLQIGWVYEDRFHWVLEGAVLMPGNSLQDEHGDAVPSFLFENRFLFLF